MLWLQKLIFPLFLFPTGQRMVTTPVIKPLASQIVSQRDTINFWQWKAAYNACSIAQKTPLTQEQLLNQINAFVKSQNSGPLAAETHWIKIDSGKQKPTDEFYTTTQFEPYVQKLEVPANAEIAFHGDVHGDIKSFNAFIEDLYKKGYMDSKDPFKIIKPNFYIIMLGDYTDRGQYGAEVLYAVMRMKQANPDTFFMVRGNHESLSLNTSYGLYHELENKFQNGKVLLQAIDRIYNYLPVALYLKSENSALQCCHGGIEVGFSHIKKLLDAPGSQKFVLLDELKRETCVHALSTSAQKAFDCVHVQDIKEYNPAMVGFMWNDFIFKPEHNEHGYDYVEAIQGRGYEYPQKITQYLLNHCSTPTCALRGVFRAHQHAPDTMPYILNKNGHTHQDNTGVAKLWPPQDHLQQVPQKLWDGIVCTFCVSPGAFGSFYNYNFDSYGILKTAHNFDDWRLTMNRLVTTQ